MAQGKKKERLFCDVEICVGNRSFSAHRGILASCSDYFETMFNTDMKEKKSGIVNIDDVSPEIFEIILEYTYTGKIDITAENVHDVLKAASMFLMGDLVTTASRFLEKEINADNVLQLKAKSQLYDLPNFVEKVEQCIVENFDVVSAQTEFLDATESEMIAYLSSSGINASEDELVYALLRWVKANSVDRRGSLQTLFPLIRLQHVTVDCILDVLLKEPLLLNNEDHHSLIFEAMQYHLRPYGIEKQEPRYGACDVSVITTTDHIQGLWMGNKTRKLSNSKASGFIRGLDHSSTVVSHEGKAFFIGGKHFSPTQILSFDGRQWKNEGDMLYARHSSSAVSIGGKLYIFGGMTQDSPVCETEMFVDGKCEVDPQKTIDTRIGHVSVAIGDSIYLIGGFTNIKLKKVQKSTISFNIVTGRKKNDISLVSGRAHFAACVLKKRIYVCGGIGGGDGFTHSSVDSVEVLNTETSIPAWTVIQARPPVSLFQTSAIMFERGQMMVLGGKSNELYCFDCRKQVWKKEVSFKRKKPSEEEEELPMRICKLGRVSEKSKFFRVGLSCQKM